MTDRSNYGPVRRMSPSVSTDNRKPYSRTGLKGVLGTLDLNSGDAAVPTPSDSPYYPFHAEIPQLEAPTQNRTSVPDGPRDIAGFPTYEQFQRIEGEYLSSLSERKQPKALISQALFDKILAVLQNGSEDRGSTAQFRFWVRKMFVLVYPQTSFNPAPGQTAEPIVLHDKRPVAIKEQLYEVLCYCHAVARHGGRDKTCATLRLNYSWVPKELTAKFVKACPTCTLKRSGNPDLLSQFGSSSPYAPLPPPPPPEPASLPVFPGGPNDSPPPGLSFVTGSEGCDDGGGGGSSGFGTSMFATPDLSVYPSPTLSAGSFGPATPSPYLPGGLFGYPAVFDHPGHHGGSLSLSSVTGWDTAGCSFSPCGLMYPEEFKLHSGGISEQQQQEASVSAEGMQLQLPRAQEVVHPSHGGGDCDNGGAGDDDNIDPELLMDGGYSPFTFVVGRPTRSATADDAETDMGDPQAGAGGLGVSGHGSDGGDGGGDAYLHGHGGRVFQYQRHHYYQQRLHAHAPPPPAQLGLALGTTTTTTTHAMGESGPPRQRQHRLRLISPRTTHDASSGTTTTTGACPGLGSNSFNGDRDREDVRESLLSLPPPPSASAGPNSTPAQPRGDNPLMNMLMFKFASSTGTSTAMMTGRPAGGVQVVAAPTPRTSRMPTAGVLGMRMGTRIEVKLFFFFFVLPFGPRRDASGGDDMMADHVAHSRSLSLGGLDLNKSESKSRRSRKNLKSPRSKNVFNFDFHMHWQMRRASTPTST